MLTRPRLLCPQRERPRHRPRRLVGDKGYSYPTVRCLITRPGIARNTSGIATFRARLITRLGIAHTIPRRTDQGQDDRFDRAIYRKRNRVERLIGWLKHFRRIAMRYEKRAHNYLAMLTLAAIKLWL